MVITLGIIGALVGIAIPSYNSYVSTAQASVVREHYDKARHVVRMTYAKAHMRRATGHEVSLPQSTQEWISLINANDALSPEGGLAYVGGASTVNPGQIGIEGSGDFRGTGVVVITQPSYRDMAVQHVTVVAANAL